MATLLGDYPELRETLSKGGMIPQEVIRTAADRKISLSAAYAEYKVKKGEEKAKHKEAVLKQNAEAKAKAPVKGAAGSGPAETKGKDPFLEGLLADD